MRRGALPQNYLSGFPPVFVESDYFPGNLRRQVPQDKLVCGVNTQRGHDEIEQGRLLGKLDLREIAMLLEGPLAVKLTDTRNACSRAKSLIQLVESLLRADGTGGKKQTEDSA